MQLRTILDILKICTVFQILCMICSSICNYLYGTLLHSGNLMVRSAGRRVSSTGAIKGEQDGYSDHHHHRTQLFPCRIDLGINVDASAQLLPTQVTILVSKDEQAPLQQWPVAVSSSCENNIVLTWSWTAFELLQKIRIFFEIIR